MHKAFRCALLAGAVALASAPAAAQQTCRDLIERFAAAENLDATKPPTVAEGSRGSGEVRSDAGTGTTSLSDTLGRSGGVLMPPPSGDQAVIQPPSGAGGNMPTAPSVAPSPGAQSGSSGESPTGTTAARAAQRAQMESLVTAARAAAERGDERQCMESLDKARQLSQRTPGTGGGG